MESAAAEPYEHGMLDVGGGHLVYWETWGSRHGIPALVVHGGPGSGAAAGWRGYFDLARYRVVLVDQRGCGRSRPLASDPSTDLGDNTTDALIADFEQLRAVLGIDTWLLLGGSWGTTLALAYAEKRPEAVSALVLFSVTTPTAREVEWITRDMSRIFPAEWDAFVASVPADERSGNLAAAYERLLAHPDPAVREDAARAWCEWED